jgi:type I restriction enzyme S subunit
MSSETIASTMNQQETTALVPKVRFPEFRGAEEWKPVPLSDLVRSLDAGVSVNSGDRPATEYEIGILKTSSVTNGIFEPLENKVVFDEVEKERVKEPVQGGTIVISRMNTPELVGANAYVERSIHNVFLPDRLWAAKPRKGVSMRFIASILGSVRSRSALSKIAKGSSDSMKNISKADVLAFRIQTPSPAEQEKIADCLSSLDELIAAQAQKVEALKTHKKGLMQQLFPREGETQPRLRFPEFQDAGEWKVNKLDELAKRGSGHTPSKRNPEYYNGGIKWVSLADSKRLDLGPISQTETEISIEGIKKSSAVLHPAGSVLLSRDAGVGKSAVMDSPMAVSQHFIVWRCDPSRLSNWFLYYVLQFMKPVFERIATGSTIKTIGLPFFKELTIAVPAPDEQQRIASCLRSLDALITAENQKLESLKTHKKGLVQQLFPSPGGDEI